MILEVFSNLNDSVILRFCDAGQDMKTTRGPGEDSSPSLIQKGRASPVTAMSASQNG